MFDRLFNLIKPDSPLPDHLLVGGTRVPLLFVHHPRARRYLLRLQPDGVARVTIPQRGSAAAAREFALRNLGWLGEQLQRQAAQPPALGQWQIGLEIYFRGEKVRVERAGAGVIRFGPEQIKVSAETTDLKPVIQKHLRKFAAKELPPRVKALAEANGISVLRVSVRNQRSRWGSCSRRGTISLNWRLIQCPAFVRDYIIFHELAHRRQMNHSDRFWQEVECLCPDNHIAEQWLKQHAKLLR